MRDLTERDRQTPFSFAVLSEALTQRVKELAERYETPLRQHVSRVDELEQNVHRHLERMGFTWK